MPKIKCVLHVRNKICYRCNSSAVFFGRRGTGKGNEREGRKRRKGEKKGKGQRIGMKEGMRRKAECFGRGEGSLMRPRINS